MDATQRNITNSGNYHSYVTYEHGTKCDSHMTVATQAGTVCRFFSIKKNLHII